MDGIGWRGKGRKRERMELAQVSCGGSWFGRGLRDGSILERQEEPMGTTGKITQTTHVSWMVTHDHSEKVLRTNQFNVMPSLSLV